MTEIKATETVALKKEGRSVSLKLKYQAGGRHRGMGVLVDLEASRFEIRSLINESAILCAQVDMFGHRHIESPAIQKCTSGLLTYRSLPWIEEHSSASREHEWRYDLHSWHLEGRKVHNLSTSRGVNIHRYGCAAAAGPELLTIPEVVVIFFNREPVLEIKAVSGHHPAGVGWLVRDPTVGGLLVEKPGTLQRHLISNFLSPGRNSKQLRE